MPANACNSSEKLKALTTITPSYTWEADIGVCQTTTLSVASHLHQLHPLYRSTHVYMYHTHVFLDSMAPPLTGRCSSVWMWVSSWESYWSPRKLNLAKFSCKPKTTFYSLVDLQQYTLLLNGQIVLCVHFTTPLWQQWSLGQTLGVFWSGPVYIPLPHTTQTTHLLAGLRATGKTACQQLQGNPHTPSPNLNNESRTDAYKHVHEHAVYF